ncbi:unnamed protein product [Boreogadus saida]
MLLRVILGQEDIRRITIDSMPETVIGLHLMLKNMLGLEGDLVVQFQDPEFANELCNLSCMSELPKDKVTLKIEAEFARLTSVDLKGSLFAGLDKYLLRFLEVYRARSGLVELNSLLSTLDNDEVETFVCILGEEDVVYDVYVAAAAIDIRPTTKGTVGSGNATSELSWAIPPPPYRTFAIRSVLHPAVETRH